MSELKPFLSVFVAAFHAAVAVVVDRTVTDVVGVHKVYDVGDCLGVMGGVAVDLNIEYVAATGQLMIRAFDFRFVARRAFVINRHMV